MIDRIARGYVVDFFRFLFVKFAVFNVADCFVTVGAIILAVYLLFYFDEEFENSKKALSESEESNTKDEYASIENSDCSKGEKETDE